MVVKTNDKKYLSSFRIRFKISDKFYNFEGGKEIGGTAQALRIVKDFNIPIFNLGNYDKTSSSYNESIIKNVLK